MKDYIKEYKSILEYNGIKDEPTYDGIDARMCCLYQLIWKHFHVNGFSIFTYVTGALFFLCIALSVFFAKAFPILADINQMKDLSEQIGALQIQIMSLQTIKNELESTTPTNKVPILNDNGVFYITLPKQYSFGHVSYTKDNRTAIILKQTSK